MYASQSTQSHDSCGRGSDGRVDSRGYQQIYVIFSMS